MSSIARKTWERKESLLNAPGAVKNIQPRPGICMGQDQGLFGAFLKEWEESWSICQWEKEWQTKWHGIHYKVEEETKETHSLHDNQPPMFGPVG